MYTAAVLGAMTAKQTKLHLAALPRHYRGLLLMGAELTDSNIHFRIMSDMTALPRSSPLLHAIITILGVSQIIQRGHWGALLGATQQEPSSLSQSLLSSRTATLYSDNLWNQQQFCQKHDAGLQLP